MANIVTLRPESAIYTPKGDGEHPRIFHINENPHTYLHNGNVMGNKISHDHEERSLALGRVAR